MVEAELRALIAASAQHDPQIKVDVHRLLLAEPLTPQPGTERIAAAIQRHAEEILGVDVPMTGVPLYTDARHYAAAGIPIVLYGAGSALDSAKRTRITPTRICGLSDLRAATKIVAMAVADLLGAGVTDLTRSNNCGARSHRTRAASNALAIACFALARRHGVADGDDALARLDKRTKAIGRCAARLGNKTNLETSGWTRAAKRAASGPSPNRASWLQSARGRSDSGRRSRSRCGRTARAASGLSETS